MKSLSLRVWTIFAMAATMLMQGPLDANAQEMAIEAPWYVSGSLGGIIYEGDEELKNGLVGTVRLGYEYNEWWSFEGNLYIAPKLKENKRFDKDTQQWVSRLEERAGEGVNDTYFFGAALDVLFHFTRWERVDPFVAAGVGMAYYGDKIGSTQLKPSGRFGGGVMYHINDEWALRADVRTLIAGKNSEVNALVDAGVIWRWGAKVQPDIVAIDGMLDSDGDGLYDWEELELGTDPYNPDTDGDGLTDYEEVRIYGTDPLNRDTDFDGLTDYEEVRVYKTDPLNWDTDAGGVSDGHEVLEDGTDPLDGSDDLLVFELYIQFDYDKDILRPEFFSDLDVVGRVLRRSETSTAIVEGHADRRTGSEEQYNIDLSKRRAQSVINYLVEHAEIDPARLTPRGLGFSRPRAPNDPEAGNPVNRRVEIYIRGDEQHAQDRVQGHELLRQMAEEDDLAPDAK